MNRPKQIFLDVQKYCKDFLKKLNWEGTLLSKIIISVMYLCVSVLVCNSGSMNSGYKICIDLKKWNLMGERLR